MSRNSTDTDTREELATELVDKIDPRPDCIFVDDRSRVMVILRRTDMNFQKPLRALFGILALLSVSSCMTVSPELAERHKSTTVPMTLWLDASRKPMPFAQYLVTAREAIQSSRWIIPGETYDIRRARVELVSPKEWPRRPACDASNTEGVLLLHGLTDSPFLMRDLGDFFNRLPGCMLIRSMLLPGHATTPGDLARVDYLHWVEAAQYGIDQFKGVATRVHVVGFSTGGALAIYWAYKQSALSVPLASLILMSPAIQPTGIIARLNILPHVAAKFAKLTGLREWLDVFADQDYAKYESFHLNAGYQIYRLDKALKKYLGSPLSVPMFIALSRDDATINSEDTIRFFLSTTNKANRMILVAPNKENELVKQALTDGRVTYITARVEGEKVIDFAHTSFVVKPENPHYGRNGDYADCLHYATAKKDKNKYCDCITPQMSAPQCTVKGSSTIFYGERDKKSVEENVLRRLTFNPHFTAMTDEIRKFLAGAARP